MDPLSITASIAGLLIAGAQIASTVQQLVSSYSSTPSLARTVQTEIHAFTLILSQLQSFVLGMSRPDISRASMIDIEQVVITLTGCVCTFSELERVVNNLGLSGLDGLRGRMKWMFAESSITPHIKQLQQHKSSLTLMLTILTCKTHSEAMDNTSRLCKIIKQLVATNTEMARRLEAIESGESTSMPIPADSSSIIDSINTTSSIRTAFERALLSTRLYQKALLRSSRASISNSKAYTSRISILSGISLSEISNLSVYCLPISSEELYNSYWYKAETNIAINSQPDKYRDSALIRAVREGAVEEVNMLLVQGVGTEVNDTHGDSVLLIAALEGHHEIVDILLEAGADKEARDNTAENTALTIAAWMGYYKIVCSLLELGADINADNRWGNTALIHAIIQGHESIVRILLERGANRDQKNDWGWGYAEISQVLLRSRADMQAAGNVFSSERLLSTIEEHGPIFSER